jgi:hypothetical protein
MKKIIILLFIIINALNIFSNEITINIDEAVELALKNNLGVEIAKLKVNEKKWNMVTSWNKFIPDVSIDLKMTRFNEQTESEKLNPVGPILGDAYGVMPETINSNVWNVSAVFDLSLEVNASIGFEIYQTINEWESGKLNLEKAKRILIKEVKKYLINYFFN